ncbi:MAG: glycosyltransferase [Thiocapsa sp.]|uniref:glycosyltransferase family 2 protein n=1 Tax=Thiocapsa sp. TaxID=2024551 RepID=UPI001BCBFD0E|nr:glycosyltransferase [Thiocapsa sp.]QVL50332.1 MAG: glycosyltransferase [Thiocapsa sp.]
MKGPSDRRNLSRHSALTQPMLEGVGSRDLDLAAQVTQVRVPCIPKATLRPSPFFSLGAANEETTHDAGLVSIIIANFNYEQYVGQAIESALSQTYPWVEVIVVDDGSTDHSLDEIRRFLPDVKLVQVEHQGQIAASTEGFRQSHGDFVIFLDADDILLPGAVDAFCKAFCSRENVVKVQGYMAVIDREGYSKGHRIPDVLPASGDYLALALRHGLLPLSIAYTSGNAWSRSFLEEVFPLPSSGWFDDYLHDLAPLYGWIESLSETVVQYRVHGKNYWYGSRALTRSAMRAHVETVNRGLDFLVEHMRKRGMPTRALQWRERKRSWGGVVVEFIVNRSIGRGRCIPWSVFILAPFGRGQEIFLKKLLLSSLLAIIWIMPTTPSMALAKLLLKKKGGWLPCPG